MALREILVSYNTPGGGPTLNVTYWDPIHPVANQVAALRNLFDSLKGTISSSVIVNVAGSGRELDDQGTLTGSWSTTTPLAVTGTGSSNPVPDSTALLVRLRSSTILHGRQVQGRMFIAGIHSTSLLNGNVLPATGVSWDTGLATLVGSALGWSIWHRPNAKGPGARVPVTSAQTWNEWAVQRRRRG